MKDMQRAIRRHHAARLKNTRRRYWGQDLKQNPHIWSRVIHTPAVCSCWACGNPRKYYRERTLQEQRALQDKGW